MTENKAIEQGNKLIAVFDGWIFNEKGECADTKQARDKFEDRPLWLRPEILNTYHSSWDWLMPVVEKIKLLWSENKLDLQLLEEDNDASLIKGLRLWCGIGLAWQSAIQFIQWYNNQKQQGHD